MVSLGQQPRIVVDQHRALGQQGSVFDRGLGHPSVIRLYNERYPKIRIRLLDLSANEGLEAVLRGEADFGIIMMSGQHPDIEFVPLVNEPFVLACRRDQPGRNSVIIG